MIPPVKLMSVVMQNCSGQVRKVGCRALNVRWLWALKIVGVANKGV